jgi:ATP-dependent Clp protease ATP-binding subunit ClpC
MFERYTEKARRVIFFARYEASLLGGDSIEPEHILLGLLREDKQMIPAALGDSDAVVESIRKEIEDTKASRHRVSASVDLPLSQGAKHVLNFAAAESDHLGHRHIGTEHLLLGVLKEESSLASQVLRKRNLTREKVIASMSEPPQPAAHTIESDAGGIGSRFVGLINKLADRGVLSREEFSSRVAARQDLAAIRVALDALLDLLVSKGVISEEDRVEIVKGR